MDEPGILLLSWLKSVGRLMTPDEPSITIETNDADTIGKVQMVSFALGICSDCGDHPRLDTVA